MMLRILFLAVLATASVGFSQGASFAPPAPTALPETGSLVPASDTTMLDTIKLPDTPIESILQLLEQWTGRSIIRPAALPTTNFSINIPGPISKREATAILESILSMNQIGLAPMGARLLKVVPLPNVRTEAPRMVDGRALDLPSSGVIMAKLFQLEFLRATEFGPQLTQFLNPQLGGPVIFDKANAIFITDSVATLQRIETLLEKLDRPVTANITPKFYNLRGGAKASAVVNQLRTTLQGVAQTQLGTSTTFSADDRTNQVILIADPRQHAFFDDLIAKLDVEAESLLRNEVIPLKHATAKDVATVISTLVSGQTKASAQGANNAQVVRPPVMNQAPSPSPGVAPPVQAPAPTTESRAEFSSLLTIISDERSNAVVVSGTTDDIRLIRDLVDKLDVLLAQVRIEVVIAEVTLGDSEATGISALGLNVAGDKLIGFSGAAEGMSVGGSTAGTFATITRPDAADFLSGRYDLAGIVSLTTKPRKSNANLLSVPTVVTTHNKEATMVVGEQRPVISSYLNDGATSTQTGSSVGSGYRSTVASKDIGIDLKVKPLIGNDGSVQLDIKLEVNDFIDNITIDGNPQPIIGRRSTTSFVSIKSGEIVVLGGLQRVTTNVSTSRLGPIPIIGDLLGSRSKEKKRIDLVFFIRPYVLKNTPEDNQEALDRVNAGPQRDSVRRALDPSLPDLPVKKEESTGPSLRRPK